MKDMLTINHRRFSLGFHFLSSHILQHCCNLLFSHFVLNLHTINFRFTLIFVIIYLSSHLTSRTDVWKIAAFFVCLFFEVTHLIVTSAIISAVLKSAKAEEGCLTSPSKNWLLTGELLECIRTCGTYKYFIVVQCMLISTVEANVFWFFHISTFIFTGYI